MVYHTLHLGYDFIKWKKTRGILFEKGGKRNFELIRSYQVINLLNGIGKIVEKIVAKELSHYCEKYSKLYFRQIKDQKERSAIDEVATLVYIVQER